MNKYKKIVLSGGPCGGKTQGVKFLKEKLEEQGLNVIVICEAAERLIKSGIDREKSFEFQKEIAKEQLKMEAFAESEATDNTVIICDRGLMDAKVYLSDDDFVRFKSELQLSEIEMRDRYDAVFHMDSIADDIGYKNSEIRTEKPGFASSLNTKSLYAWCGNPHYRFIPACNTLKDKLDILLKEVCAFIGVPRSLEIEKKLLIKMPDVNILLNQCCQKVNIIQYYLVDGDNRFRIRSRGNDNDSIYVKTQKTKITDTVYEEIEYMISKKEFDNYLSSCLVQGSISKERYCLMYNGVYFEIDIFPFWKNQAFLEVELLSETEYFQVPDFIQVLEDVTCKPEYKNSALSKNIPEEKIRIF